jgi:hypothetical protein
MAVGAFGPSLKGLGHPRRRGFDGKVGAGQERQGLKPDIFSIVYGPTKVVP